MTVPSGPHDAIRSAALTSRRERFARDHGARSVVIAAGSAPSRNYPANRHPFRASSHFLHFAGTSIEGAVLLLDPQEPTLFVRDPEPDDALWHGPPQPRDAIADATGLRIRSLLELASEVARLAPIALPSFDPSIRAQLGELGVAIARGDDEDRLADAIVGSRLRHDAYAARELRRAASISRRAHLAGMAVTRPGIPASVPRAVMEAVITARSAVTAYGSIVTPRGDVLHAGPTDVLLAHGDLLLCDVGAESDSGYASDVTRTYPVNGIFDPAARDVYAIVLEAQRATIAAITVGVRYRELHLVAMHAVARGLVALGLLRGDPAERATDGSVALFFPHGVGHLLGLDVHDLEDLGDRAGYAPGRTRASEPGLRYLRLDRDLAPGMAFTIEPGIYFVPAILDDPEVRRTVDGRVAFDRVADVAHLRGIRIEDDVLLDDRGAEVLTGRIPKTVDELESVVGTGIDWSSLTEPDPA